jgi:hypothetical protein
MKWTIFRMKWARYLKKAFCILCIKKRFSNNLYVKKMLTPKARKIRKTEIHQYKNSLKIQKRK